jgi:succinate dehydrogenase / fumarate reductase, membrane anchor subunit
MTNSPLENGSSLRTPLARVRYLGAAHTGTPEATLMRLTSAALLILTIGFVWLVLSLLSKDYNGVRAALGHPIPAIVMMLYVSVGVYHMQIGMRSIILDYMRGHAKDWALMANTAFASVLGLTCVYAVMRIGFA